MASSKNFTSDELKCSCCGEEQIQQWALDKLQVIREEVGPTINYHKRISLRKSSRRKTQS